METIWVTYKYQVTLDSGEICDAEKHAPDWMPKSAIDPVVNHELKKIKENCKALTEVKHYVDTVLNGDEAREWKRIWEKGGGMTEKGIATARAIRDREIATELDAASE